MKIVLCLVYLVVIAAAVQEDDNGLFNSDLLTDIMQDDYDMYDYESPFEQRDKKFSKNTNDNENKEPLIDYDVFENYQFEDNRFNDADKSISKRGKIPLDSNKTKAPSNNSENLDDKLRDNRQRSHKNNNIANNTTTNINTEKTYTTTVESVSKPRISSDLDSARARNVVEELFNESDDRKVLGSLSGEMDELLKTLEKINDDDADSNDDVLEYEEENDRPYKEGHILSLRDYENFEDELVNILSEEVIDPRAENFMESIPDSDDSHFVKGSSFADKNDDLISKVLRHSYGNDGLVDDRMPIDVDAEILSTTEAASSKASQSVPFSVSDARFYWASDSPSSLASEVPFLSASQAVSISENEAPSSIAPAPLKMTAEFSLDSENKSFLASEAPSSSASGTPYSKASEDPSSSASEAPYSTSKAPSSSESESPSSSGSEVPFSLGTEAPSSFESKAPSSSASEAPYSTSKAPSSSESESPSSSGTGTPYFSEIEAPSSSTSDVTYSDYQNSLQYDHMMSVFTSKHSEDLDTTSAKFNKNVAPIHITLSVDEPTVITSPGYPAPYPTNNIVDWIIEGPGMGIELNITDFQVNGAMGDYLLVKPGGINASGTDGLVFSFRLLSERRYRFLNVNRMFVRFEAKMGMQFFNGFSFSVKMIRPLRDIEEKVPEPEPVKQDPTDTLTLSLAGISMPRFHVIKADFKSLVADMAQAYIKDYNIDQGLNPTSEVTQITKTAVCNIRWPNYETCVDVTFGVPLQYEDDSMPYRLSSHDLDFMWNTYIDREPFATRFKEMGVTEYNVPADSAALLMWVAVALGIVISLSLLFFVVWRFRCFEDYTRMRSYVDVDAVHSDKKFNELYPTPHQNLPPMSTDNEFTWTQSMSFTNNNNSGYTNKSYEQDDSMFDFETDDDENAQRDRSGSIEVV